MTVDATRGPIRRPRQAHGLRRFVLMGAGWFFVLIACLGALMPGIPTTPWVLSAAYCFDRSSERFSNWLRRTPVFGKLIADWERYRGIRKRTKMVAIGTVVVVVSCSITFSPLPVVAKWIIGVWACIGIGTIGFIVPTIKESTVQESATRESAMRESATRESATEPAPPDEPPAA